VRRDDPRGRSRLAGHGRAKDRQVPNVKKAICTGYGGCAWSNVMILGADLP